MSRASEWLKKNRIKLFKTILMTALPLLCCLVYCATQGRSIREVFIPGSPWNDELLYFKQVEGVAAYGIPQGYFGYNESHALRLSFAAWSPVLMFPWFLWGLLFGWNLMSPVICNIFLMSLSMLLFMVLAEPTWKQTGILAFLYCLYTPFVRYMLSGMPEVLCFSILIIFYGVAVSELKAEKRGKLAFLFALAAVMTLMRPYLLLFFLLPAYLCTRKYRFKGAVLSILAMGLSLGGYALLNHYLAAPYVQPLFDLDWIHTFLEDGIGAGISGFLKIVYWKGTKMLQHIVDGFRTGEAKDAYFTGFVAVFLVLLGQSVADLFGRNRTGKRNQLILEVHLTVSFLGMILALLVMYQLEEGSKHLLTFMAVGIFVVALMDTRTFKKTAFIGAAFAYLYIYRALNAYDYQVPFAEPVQVAQWEAWQEIFDREMTVSGENAPSYDNVIIWTFYEKEGEDYIFPNWQLLYALPEGMGITCCRWEYLTDNFGNLRSRYLMTISGGELDTRCSGAGFRELGRDQDIVVYELY